MAYQLINNLRYGQVSERMAGRFDLDVYRQGAQRLENFICMRQGGVTRRPPLKHLADVDSATTRIVSMTLNASMSICICLSTKGFTVYSYSLGDDGSYTFSKFADLTSWPTGYAPTADGISSMSFAQHYSYLYVACRGLKLGRFKYSSTGLSFEVCNIRTNEEKKEIQDEGFSKDSLMESSIHCPSGNAIVSDRQTLFCTDAERDTIWWSRVIGTSQTMTEDEDSLLDFVQYDGIETESEQIKDASDWPLTRKYDSNGALLCHTETIGGGSIEDAIFKIQDAYDDSSFDGKTGRLYQAVKTSTDSFEGEVGKVYVFTDASHATPYIPTGRSSNLKSALIEGTDYWRWPYWEYDLSDTTDLVDTVSEKDYVETSTTAMKNQLATGRMDGVLWMCQLDSIYIGTETSVWAVPSGANALNLSAQRIASHPLYGTKPVALGSMLVYATKGGRIRGLSSSNGSASDVELTLTADGIIDKPIVCMEGMDVPEPTLYVVLSDGSMRTLTIDSDYGLQGWAVWTFGCKVRSIAKIEDGSDVQMLCLVEDGPYRWIGFLDYKETSGFKDHSKTDGGSYESILTMHRLDSYGDGGATIGERKSIRNIVFRTMDSGKAVAGYSERDMKTTPKPLGSTDAKYAVNGGSMNELRFTVKSNGDEPLTLLALAYEAGMNGG